MDFYLNLLNDKERAPDDQPSIGIILCAENDELVVEFSSKKTKTNPIGVAEYQLTTSCRRNSKASCRASANCEWPCCPTSRCQSRSPRRRNQNESDVDLPTLACGSYDHSAFTRAFRKVANVTPTQFREMLSC